MSTIKRLVTLTGAFLTGVTLQGLALAQTELSLWYHGAGNPVERELVTKSLLTITTARKTFE